MKKMYTIISFFIPFIVIIPVSSVDIEDHKEFFESMEKNMVYEYQLCTGDTSEKSFSTIVEWKEQINQKTQSPEYKVMLKEFIMATGIVKDVMPCMVLKWYLDRKTNLHNFERKINKDLLKHTDTIVDSIRLYSELKNNPVTLFDFIDIPIGISQKAFRTVYTRECKYPLFDKRRYQYIEHYLIDEMPFIIKFYFSTDRIYYKYEILSYTFSGNHFNSEVRSGALLLKEWMEEKIGDADHTYRLGYFDIKSNTEMIYTEWVRETHSVNIVLGLIGNKYYTKLTVESKTIPHVSRGIKRK